MNTECPASIISLNRDGGLNGSAARRDGVIASGWRHTAPAVAVATD